MHSFGWKRKCANVVKTHTGPVFSKCTFVFLILRVILLIVWNWNTSVCVSWFRRPGEHWKTVKGPKPSAWNEWVCVSSCAQPRANAHYKHPSVQSEITYQKQQHQSNKDSIMLLLFQLSAFPSSATPSSPPAHPQPPPGPSHLYQVVCRSAAWQELVFCDGSV